MHDDADYTFQEVETALVSVQELRWRGFDWLDIPAQLYEDPRWSSPGDPTQAFEWQPGTRATTYQRADWQPGRQQCSPRHPCFVWHDLKWGYALPEWLPIIDGEDAIHYRFPPRPGTAKPVSANTLEKSYVRGMKRVKRDWKSAHN